MNEKLMGALLKKALGYTVRETVEEFSGEDMVKKKVSKKHIPPDVGALRAYLEFAEQRDVSTLSDAELEKEKSRLMQLLAEGKFFKQKSENTTETDKKALCKRQEVVKAVATKATKKNLVQKAESGKSGGDKSN